MQCADLVVHQSNQGGNHDGDSKACALAGDGGDLVAERFAAACGHQHQGVAAAAYVFYDGLLGTAELFIAKNVVEDGEVIQDVLLSGCLLRVFGGAPVLHRFSDVNQCGVGRARQVGNGAGNFEGAVGAACRPRQLGRRIF